MRKIITQLSKCDFAPIITPDGGSIHLPWWQWSSHTDHRGAVMSFGT